MLQFRLRAMFLHRRRSGMGGEGERYGEGIGSERGGEVR